jgi:hypothetical protein
MELLASKHERCLEWCIVEQGAQEIAQRAVARRFAEVQEDALGAESVEYRLQTLKLDAPRERPATHDPAVDEHVIPRAATSNDRDLSQLAELVSVSHAKHEAVRPVQLRLPFLFA